MAKLTSLLANRTPDPVENNLEEGRIYFYGPAVTYDACRNFCFCAPATGTAIIEAVGPGGSAAKMCCCGGGLPGNSGAYVKKECFTMNANQYICGCTGKACNDADALCFRGCSGPTTICWQSSTADGCMCAEGGLGGCTTCNPNTSIVRCFRCNNFCWTSCGFDNTECAIICNYGGNRWHAQGYGGDINCPSNIGCVTFYNCNNGHRPCQAVYHVPMPAGFYFSEDGAIISYQTGTDNGAYASSGGGIVDFLTAINGASRNPDVGPWQACWRYRYYGCYNTFGCGHWLPYGAGGPPPQPCPGVRDHGAYGGTGAVRIRFIES